MKSKITNKTITFKCNIANCIVLKSFDKKCSFHLSPPFFSVCRITEISIFSQREKKMGLIVINTADMSSLKSRIPIEWLVDELTEHIKTLLILNLIVWGCLISPKKLLFLLCANYEYIRSKICAVQPVSDLHLYTRRVSAEAAVSLASALFTEQPTAALI